MGARNMEKGQKALDEVKARKPQGTLSLLQLDVSDDSSIYAAAKSIEAEYGRVDVLVNNAGNQIQSENPSREELRTTFETNVFGATILTQVLTPLIIGSHSKRIINVSSELGSINQRADPNHGSYHVGMPAYRMSKAALNMLTTCQYHDLKGHGVKVWSFCPGFVSTDLAGPGFREKRAAMGAESPETSAQGLLDIIEGKRDAEVGAFVARYGRQPLW